MCAWSGVEWSVAGGRNARIDRISSLVIFSVLTDVDVSADASEVCVHLVSQHWPTAAPMALACACALL